MLAWSKSETQITRLNAKRSKLKWSEKRSWKKWSRRKNNSGWNWRGAGKTCPETNLKWNEASAVENKFRYEARFISAPPLGILTRQACLIWQVRISISWFMWAMSNKLQIQQHKTFLVTCFFRVRYDISGLNYGSVYVFGGRLAGFDQFRTSKSPKRTVIRYKIIS